MSNSPKKRFFANHAKSSAALISLGIHALLIVVALSFVAVTVITKDEQKFEAKQVHRPRMPMKRLQVPVKINKKRPKPKLRKRIVVQPKLNQTMPDIKMPEITGVKGGIGSAGDGGIGGAGGVGFSMPEINLFGVKSKGEKIFLILDSTPWMMYDEIGGIPGYTVIKQELVRILGDLSPTVLFNIAVYDNGSAVVLYPKMVSANAANVAKVGVWLNPLNAVKTNMGDRDYGVKTLGTGGSKIEDDLAIEPVQTTRHWAAPAMLAMQEQADSVFVLTQGWGHLFHDTAPAKPWSPEKLAKYREIQKKAAQKLADENEERRKNSQPPRVLVGGAIVNTYFPGTQHPPGPERHHYSAKEMAEAFENQREASKSKIPATSGLGNKNKKERFSINVIHFIKQEGANANDQEKFKQFTREMDGDYRTLAGLEAIRSSASGSGDAN